MKAVILLKQHVGKACQPVVAVGEKVKRGQLIAVPQGLGVNIHASVSGVVSKIDAEAITIDADEEQTSKFVHVKDSGSHLADIKEAGIVGAGGAGFPTYIKLSADLKGGCVIANAAECEPLLNHNISLLEKDPEIILRGLKYALQITGAGQGYIAIKAKNKEALIKIGKACKQEENIEIKLLPDMYPAGDERVIVRELLGVELKPGQLPLEVKAVVLNVETLKNIVLAIEERKPVLDKDITVAGRVVAARQGKVFLDVPLGMPLELYITKSGGYLEPHGEILVGGAFINEKVIGETPVTKTTGGILVGMTFPSESRKVGLLACECGAGEDRLQEIAVGMKAKVVVTTKCKRMATVNGRYRCDLPGNCPGQAETVLHLVKQGAEVIIIGTCET